MSIEQLVVGEINTYPSEEVMQAGTTVLEEMALLASRGETIDINEHLMEKSELQAAARLFIDPETSIDAESQVKFITALLGVLSPSTEMPDFSGKQWASLWPRAEHHKRLRFMAAPLLDKMVERQGFVEQARQYLPHDFTPFGDLTALRAPDPGTVIADLMDDLGPEGGTTVEREGELFVARYESPWSVNGLDEFADPEAYGRILIEEGYRRDLAEGDMTIEEEFAGCIPLAGFISPLRNGPVNRAEFREDMLTIGAALRTNNGVDVGVTLMDVQQNAPRREASIGSLYPRISPYATHEVHLLGEIIRQIAGMPDMNMTINAINESGWALNNEGELEEHPRYVGTVRFRTDDPTIPEKRDYAHRIGAYARMWQSTRAYMAVRDARAAFMVPVRNNATVLTRQNMSTRTNQHHTHTQPEHIG